MTELVESQNGKHEQAVVYNAAGRAIRYVVFGARDLKRVVFYSHGFPASRVEAGLAHTAARERGITVVALDRPGFGGSAWYGERSFQDWADDVVTVANHLGVERFGVLGVSGGTPTAVAAAGALSERVTKLVIVSGMGPLAGREVLAGMNIGNRALLELGLCMPSVARYSIALIARLWRRFPMLVSVWFGALLPSVDREIMRRREVGVLFAKNIREALSQGVKGAVTEFCLLLTDWSGLLENVQVPTEIWHGDADTYVPLVMAQRLQAGIKDSVLHQVKDGGHFMIVDRLPAVLASFA